MAKCEGDGACLVQTDENTYEHTACSHACELVECKNYKHCGMKIPKWVLTIHNDMCVGCACMEYDGKTTFTDTKQECPVCYDEKYMMKLPCNHLLCLMCLYGMFSRNENIREHTPDAERTKCPLCRNTIETE